MPLCVSVCMSMLVVYGPALQVADTLVACVLAHDNGVLVRPLVGFVALVSPLGMKVMLDAVWEPKVLG